jgi:hypothetical protein
MPKGTTPLEEAAVQNRLWTPSVLRPAAWFDFSVGLRDISDNQLAVTVVGSPSVSADFYNGRSGRVFTQASAYLSMTLSLMNTEWSVAYVLVRAASTDNYFVFGSGTASPSNGALWSGVRNSGTTAMLSQWLNDFDASNVPAFQAKTPIIINGSRRSTGRSLKTNGGSLQTNSNTTLPTGGSATTLVGSAPAGSSTQPFTLCEMLVFQRGTTDQEMALLEGYLGHKWGVRLAGDNPFVNRPPVIGD